VVAGFKPNEQDSMDNVRSEDSRIIGKNLGNILKTVLMILKN
jgi:hypothetical protein